MAAKEELYSGSGLHLLSQLTLVSESGRTRLNLGSLDFG